MTSITRNLPPVIRNLGVSIVGEKCYVSLVEDLNFTDVLCVQYAVSKGMGLGIVVGGAIVKVPQIITIIRAQSAEGLSLSGYILETLAYSVSLAYSIANKHPFSTYGENFFLTLQDVIITFLIVLYPSSRGNDSNSGMKSYLALSVLLGLLSLLPFLPPAALTAVQLSTLPLSLFSKLTQIQQNYAVKSTGQLSAFAVISQTVGCIVRLYTSLVEVGDVNVALGFGGALVLNTMLACQLWVYHGQYPRRLDEKASERKTQKVGKVAAVKTEEQDGAPAAAAAAKPEVIAPEPARASTPSRVSAYGTGSTTPRRVSTPQPQNPGSGRKWTRKED